MSDPRPRPSHGEDIGPCAVCGSWALPKYGEFLCAEHGTLKHARTVQAGDKDA